MATAKPTTDHDEIRRWVESRGGHPARVRATGSRKDPGILRIDFPGYSGEETLEEIEWDEFFEWFDRNKLAMLLSTSRRDRFSKLVSRATAKKSSAKKKKAATSTKKASSAKKKSATSSSKKASSTKKKSASKKAAPAKKTSAKKTSAKKKAPAKKATSSKKSSAKKAAAKKPSARRALAARTAKKASAKKTTKKRATTAAAKTTTNRDEIIRWVEARGGYPAHVKRTEGPGDDPGVLRIDYPGFSGKGDLERISWDEFFEWFDRNKLAFLYQDKKNSRFSKLVAR